ncbi:MAG: hypothetical protein ACRDYD_04320 [Acidimicrobiales bacterium]
MRSLRTIRRRLRMRRGEQGFALITVVLISAIMSLLLATVTRDAIAGISISQHSQDWNAALGASQAGVGDFTYRLNSNEAYSYCIAQEVQTGSTGTGYCSGAGDVPPAATGWVAVPDNSGSAYHSCFTYTVPSNGLVSGSSLPGAVTSDASAILLDVTGKVTTGSCSNAPVTQRKIRVTLTRTTYLNYAYFTDRETQDPNQYAANLSAEFSGVSKAQQYATQYCSNYYFALSPGNVVGQTPAGGIGPVQSTDIRASHSTVGSYTHYTQNNICTFTKFDSGDTFNGPVHTNDVFFFNSGATFNGPVEVGHDASETTNPSSSAPTCGSYPTPTAANNYDRGDLWVDAQYVVQGSHSGVPHFNGSPPIRCTSPIPLPTANSNLQQQAKAGGCVYHGLTYLYFDPSGAVDVYSQGGDAGSGWSGCVSDGSFTPSGTFNGIIYVQNVANDTSCSLAPGFPGQPSIIQTSDLNQLQNDPSGNSGVNPNAYDCHNGDAFVGGNLSGQLTVGTENNIVVYQDLTYADDSGYTVKPSGSNVLGLEPQGSVQLYHPVYCPGFNPGDSQGSYDSCDGGNSSNILSSPGWSGCGAMAACQTNYVQAAILCFNGELTAENWAFGSGLGTIHVTGSVAQRYRGRLAGTGNGAGYGKTFGYDPRLANITPPFFLPPNIFSWTQSSFAETTSDSSH